MLIKETNSAGLAMLEIAWVGIPVMFIVFIFILLFSKWLLPERLPAISRYDDAREYTVEMLVEKGSVLSGKSIDDA
jgi:di/tricarboxylate transporter